MNSRAHIGFLCLTVLSTWFLIIPLQAQWIKLNSGTTESLTASYFVNRDTGYVIGMNSIILKTIDGGINWDKLNSGTTQTLSDIYFASSNNGYIAADSGYLLITEDGGNVWKSKHLDSTSSINAVFFANSNVGFAAGNDAFLLKTMDGGKTWVDVAGTLPVSGSCANLDLRTLYFFNENSGYAGGGDGLGTLLKTNNGGASWNTFDNNLCYENEILKISCISEQKCFAMGFYARINQIPEYRLIRFDADSAITISNTFYYDYYGDVYMSPQGVGYLVGKTMYKTTDFFEYSWIQDTTYSGLKDLFFPDNEVGYAVGSGGTILKTTNAGLGMETKDTETYAIALYPNPTINNISIAFSVNYYEPVSCIIYNLIGQETSILINKVYHNPGNYTQDFNISFLKPGIYFFTFQSNSHSTIKKIVKVE